MKYFGKAEETANAIVKAFAEGRVPAALSQLYIEDAMGKHCANYSFFNRFIVAIHGYSDAMGMKQWNQKHGRYVKKGEKALYILAPILKTISDETVIGKDGKPEKKSICVGFKGVQVFGLEQTTGPEIKQGEKANQFLNELPLKDLADKWGLKVNAYNGQEGSALGMYVMGSSINLGVQNLSTWTHELAHAADDRLGNLNHSNKDRALDEVVAEFAGATILKCLGKDEEADLGGAWAYIQNWASATKIEPIDACRKVFTRVVSVVNLILEESGIKSQEVAA